MMKQLSETVPCQFEIQLIMKYERERRKKRDEGASTKKVLSSLNASAASTGRSLERVLPVLMDLQQDYVLFMFLTTMDPVDSKTGV